MVFILYRPVLPALRAQSIQIVYSAHALASRGTTVVLCYEPGEGDPLKSYGLAPHPDLRLIPLPRSRTLASVAFRAHVLRFARRGAVFLARSKRYARDLLRWFPSARLIVEAHEVDSLQANDPSQKRRIRALEEEVFSGAEAVVCNCEGVRDALLELHTLPARVTVVHNAAQPVARSLAPSGLGRGVGFAGSLIAGKDVETVARAASMVGGITWIGEAEPARVAELVELSEGALTVAGPVNPAQLGVRLQQLRTLVLPLGSGLFGEQFTSPLKAFSYAAARVPFVGADTPALHRAVPGAFHPYRPGDVASLVRGIRAVQADESLRTALVGNMRDRTWHQRASEMEAVFAR